MLKINTDFYRCFYICMDSFPCLPGRDLSWGSDHVVPSWIFMPPDILCLGNPSINSLIPSFIHLLICLFFLCVISMWYLQFIGTYSTKISYEDQSKWNGGNGGFTFYSLEIRSWSQSQVMSGTCWDTWTPTYSVLFHMGICFWIKDLLKL